MNHAMGSMQEVNGDPAPVALGPSIGFREQLKSHLPSSVLVAEAGNTLLYVIGTAHVSSQSARDVRKTIRLVQPHAVMVELCATRGALLMHEGFTEKDVTDDEGDGSDAAIGFAVIDASDKISHPPDKTDAMPNPGATISARQMGMSFAKIAIDWFWWLLGPIILYYCGLPGSSFSIANVGAWSASLACGIGALRTIVGNGYLKFLAPYLLIKQDEGTAILGTFIETVRHWKSLDHTASSLFRAFLLVYLSKVGKDLEADVGAEFHVAVVEAHKLQAKLIFGDQKMKTTLRRLWASLTVLQKVRFFLQLALEIFITHTESMVEQLKSPALVEEMTKGITDAFPALATVLLTERDRWMAQQLAKAHFELQGMQANGSLDVERTGGYVVMVAVVGMGHRKGVVKEFTDLAKNEMLPEFPPLADPSPPLQECLLDYCLVVGCSLLTLMWILDCNILSLVSLLLLAVITTSGLSALPSYVNGRSGSPPREQSTQHRVHEIVHKYRPVVRRTIDTMANRWAVVLSWEYPVRSLKVMAAIFLIGETLGRLPTFKAAVIVFFGGLLMRFFRTEVLHYQRLAANAMQGFVERKGPLPRPMQPRTHTTEAG